MAGRRAGIQLCYPLEENRLVKSWGFPANLPAVICQPKLDGERCRVDWFDGGMYLISSEENPFFYLSHIEQAIQEYLPRLEFDGEMYVHGWSMEKIHSVLSRKVNEHPEASRMEYHIFDICNEQTAQATRLRFLREAFKNVPVDAPIKLVPSHPCRSMQDIYDLYYDYRVDGYEGIILRHPLALYRRTRSTEIMKFKPKKFDDYLVVELVEAVSLSGEPLNMLGAIWCSDPEGNRFKISAGELSHEKRREVWADKNSYIGRYVHVGYQSTTARGVPRFGVTVNFL